MNDLAHPYGYFAFGFHIRSERPLPELAPALDAQAADVLISWGRAPESLDGASYWDGAMQVAGGDLLLQVQDLARFHLAGGDRIVVDPMAGSSDRHVRAYLMGTILGILCHRRLRLPLHANAVEFDGRAVAFAGPSGMGKSTLAAHFQSRGYRVLTDDICAISFPEGGPPLAWTGVPRIRLWRDSAEALGHDVGTLEPVADEIDKYCLPPSPDIVREGAPLRALYVLTPPQAGEPDRLERLSGWRAADAVMEQVFRREVLNPLGASRNRFGRTLALLEHVPVYRAPWRQGYADLAAQAAKLETHVRAEASTA